MLQFFKKSKKDQLKEQIEKARIKNEEELKQKESLWKQKFDKIKEQITVFSYLGNFKGNIDILNQYKDSITEESLIELKLFIKSEELKYLENKIKFYISKKDKDKSSSFLADIHIRANEEIYQKYSNEVNKLSGFDEIKSDGAEIIDNDFEKQLYEDKIYEDQKNEYLETVDDSVKKEVKEQQESEKKENKKGLFDKMKLILINEVNKTKHIFELLKKEHRGEKIDKFLATEKVLNKDNDEEKRILEVNLPEESVDNFENIFGVTTDSERDIIETLLDDSVKDAELIDIDNKEGDNINIGKKRISLVNSDANEEDIEYVNPFIPYLKGFEVFMVLSISMLVLSWFLFFIQTDQNNYVLNFFKRQNLYIQKEEKLKELNIITSKIEELKTELKKIEKGSVDVPEKIALKEIILNKIDWMQIQQDLNEATLNAFTYNDILNYIKYYSFVGNLENKSLTITGEIQDPSGRVFSLESKLIKSINDHPTFDGAEIKTFSKSKNSNDEVGGYLTSFSLNLKYKTKADIKALQNKQPEELTAPPKEDIKVPQNKQSGELE